MIYNILLNGIAVGIVVIREMKHASICDHDIGIEELIEASAHKN